VQPVSDTYTGFTSCTLFVCWGLSGKARQHVLAFSWPYMPIWACRHWCIVHDHHDAHAHAHVGLLQSLQNQWLFVLHVVLFVLHVVAFVF
jgi:hypothetical protein